MKVPIKTFVDAKEIPSVGDHLYLVALEVGGIMEQPEITYHDYQVVHANSEEEALKTYNEYNDCNYFYGKIIKEIKRR